MGEEERLREEGVPRQEWDWEGSSRGGVRVGLREGGESGSVEGGWGKMEGRGRVEGWVRKLKD